MVDKREQTQARMVKGVATTIKIFLTSSFDSFSSVILQKAMKMSITIDSTRMKPTLLPISEITFLHILFSNFSKHRDKAWQTYNYISLDEKWNFLIEEIFMTRLNFRHISYFFTGNLALSSTKHVQDGSDILMQDT